MKYLLFVVLLGGCALPKPRPGKTIYQNYEEKRKESTERCVIRLLNQGIDQQLVYPICKDIHDKKPLIHEIQSNGL